MNAIDNKKMKADTSQAPDNSADVNKNRDQMNASSESMHDSGSSRETQEKSGKEDHEHEASRDEIKRDRPSDDEQIQDVTDEKEEAIARLEEELAKTRDSMLRKAAEFENLKRRTQKEKQYIYEEARADAISKFLGIREDLKRSIDLSLQKDVDKSFRDGLQMLLDNFDRILKDYNVEPIEETGVPFDVDQHDAMLTQPSEDNTVDSNTVLQILEPGYKMGDRVIKHAKVIVSQ